MRPDPDELGPDADDRRVVDLLSSMTDEDLARDDRWHALARNALREDACARALERIRSERLERVRVILAELLPDMQRAVDRLFAARAAGEALVIFGSVTGRNGLPTMSRRMAASRAR